jgi:vancomycin resistance protein VanW
MAVWYRRLQRYFEWYFGGEKYAKIKMNEKLPYRIKKHQSVLVRKLGDSDLQLQYNKVVNLQIAHKKINGILIRPGETLSLCKLIGRTTKRKGYLPGMELCFGESRPGIGGGLCQIANLVHWMVLHSPLTIIERHHHSYDPFPDDGRVLPFGSGATIFYNYHDLRVKNNTSYTFQINLWLSEKCLEGELRMDTELDYAYHVYEENHKFLKINGEYYRTNEIWRNKIAKLQGGEVLARELITKNFALVKYIPEQYEEMDASMAKELYSLNI